MQRRHPVALAALAMPTGAAALAQSYPNKTIRLIAPFAAGGATDIVIQDEFAIYKDVVAGQRLKLQ